MALEIMWGIMISSAILFSYMLGGLLEVDQIVGWFTTWHSLHSHLLVPNISRLLPAIERIICRRTRKISGLLVE
jgi:hypothetical protein